MSGTPVTEDEVAHWLDLHAQGYSVRSIARECGRGYTTVGRHLNRMGCDTDRSQTAEATAARVRVVNARRLDRAEQLMEDMASLQERIWEPYVVVANGPDGPARVHLDEPPLKEQADGYRAIQAMARTVDELIAAASGDTGADAAKNLLTGIFDGLKAIADAAPADPDDRDHDYDIAHDPNERAGADVQDDDGMMWVDCDCTDLNACECEDVDERDVP